VQVLHGSQGHQCQDLAGSQDARCEPEEFCEYNGSVIQRFNEEGIAAQAGQRMRGFRSQVDWCKK
jgi:hypothetical protein